MEIRDDAGGVVGLTGSKRRALVAILGLRPGEALARDLIAEDLWDGRPPPSAASTIKGNVSNIRKLLGSEVVRTTPAGYLLVASRADVDTTCFEDMVRSALSSHDERSPARAERLADAVSLWTGQPLTEFRHASWAQIEARRLENLRETALESWMDARLDIGDHAALVSVLSDLVVEFPLRERFWSQLMIALYRCGRQADALRSFAGVRRLLAEELGIDPSRDLVELEAAILDQDPRLDWSPQNDVIVGSSNSLRSPPAQQVASFTLLLTDLVGSTQLWEHHPREMAVALARHQEMIASSVERAGGELVKPRGEGDSTFSVFRLATSAVAAAAEIQRRFAEEAWPRETPLQVRVGVHTGEVELRDGDYYGVTVNRAARLRALAAAGEVLLSGTTSGLVADTLPSGTSLIDYGLRPLRDLSRPEHIFALSTDTEASTAATSVQTDLAPHSALHWTRTGDDAPFVGRAEALTALQAHWDGALAGSRQLVFVAGEPGAGKTRLAAEIARRCNEQGALVLYGRWDEEPISPFQGFLEALGRFAERCPPTMLIEDVRSLVSDLEPLFPQLASYGDMPLVSRASAESERFRLFEAIDAWLRRIAERCPLLLVLDDLHWADRSALMLLRNIARSTSGDRVMILGAFRDTNVNATELSNALVDLRRSAGFGRIDVEGLCLADVDELLVRSGGANILVRPRDFARAALEETSGNAFFVSEIVRELISANQSRPVSMNIDELRIPESVREMVASRVNHLSAECADLLRIASVIGPEFGVRVIRRIADLDVIALETLLDEAEASRLIQARESDGYVFAHAVIRNVLHDGLNSSRRRRLHRRTGEVLEGEHAADQARRRAELAYHFCEGADDEIAEKAISCAREAAGDAFGQLAFEAAAENYGRALRVLSQYEDDPTLRCELLLAAGNARNHAGQSQIAKELFVSGAGIARTLGRMDLLVQAALGYGGELPASLEPDEQATQLLGEALDAIGTENPLARACALGRLAQWSYFVVPPEERRAYCDEAIQLARASDDLHVLATVLTSYCRALEGPEDLDGQLRIADEIIALGDALGDHEVTLQGLRCRLNRVFEYGDFAEATTIVTRMRELAEALRSPEYLRLITSWDGVVAGTRGAFLDAAQYMRETVALMAGHPQMRRVLYFQALPWRALQDQTAEGLKMVATAATAEPEITLWRALWAWFAAEADQLELAAEQLDWLDFNALEPESRRFDFFIIFVGAAIAIHRTGDVRRAAKLYELMLPYAGRNCTLGVTAFYGAVDHYLGLLCTTLGREQDGVKHFERALTRHAEMDAAPFVAMTQMAFADHLDMAVGTFDGTRANELRAEATVTAERLGLTSLLRRAPAA